MSQVIIAGDTSGTITLQAPAVSGSSVLTLPATTATLATLTTPSFTTTIGVGAATASASGAGVTFPATINASSNANTLDDYEEGTWTGAFSPGANITGTPTLSEGRYTKIGNNVHLQGKITATVTLPNTLTYLLFVVPFTEAFVCAGSVMDNNTLISGSGQIGGGGYMYAFFASSALLPSGATIFYVSFNYQV